MELTLKPNAWLKPTMPPGPIEGFVDSDILLDLKGIPPEIGNCTITGVRVTVANPDNVISTVDCTRETDGTWSCTIPGSTKSGRMPNGVQILIDGTTPGGGSVDGYVLAICNLAIYTRDMKIKPNGTLLRYFDVAPEAPKKGDVAPFDGVLKMYNGTEWESFGAEVDLSDYYTKEETDEQIDKLAAYYITADAQGNNFATRAALLNAETYYSGGVARVPTRNDYAVVLADETHSGAEWRYIYAVAEGQTTGQWEAQYPIETNDYTALSNKPQIGGVELLGNKTPEQLGLATRGDITLTARGEGGSGYSDWTFDPDEFLVSAIYFDRLVWNNGIWEMHGHPDGIAADLILTQVAGPEHAVRLDFPKGEYTSTAVTATRTAYGYILGDPNDSSNPNRNKPVARQEDLDAANEVIVQNQTTVEASIASVEAALNILRGQIESVAASQRYSFGPTITASTTLADREGNRVIPASDNTTDIVLSFPAAVPGKMRDFTVLITNTTGNTGAITFNPPGGATIYGTGLEQTIASGETWLVTVTEVAAKEFFCKAEKVEGKVVPWWLYFEAEASNVVVNMTKTGSPTALTLETSTDGETWTTFDSEGGTTPITLANVGDKVYFRAGQGGNTKTGGGYWSGDYHTFTLSGLAGAHGNVMSLLDGANKDNVAFTSSGGFSHLFEGCTNLTSAPDLPATTLASDCYAAMFKGCTSLTSIPEALPATTLYEYSYRAMFSGCTSLTAGPTIMATTLAQYSMWDMFEYCSVLSAVEVRFASWSPNPYQNACQEWMERVSSTGTIKCPAALGTNETITRDYSHCPTGWTVVNI